MKSTYYLFLLFSLLLTSCSRKIKEFKINNGKEQITLTLYSDSTFTEKVQKIEKTLEYYGNWYGNITEDSTFYTITTGESLNIYTQIPKKHYKIKKGKLIKVTQL